jgi:hypothetical protein
MEDPCFGCYMSDLCLWKHLYAHLCPCKTCIIKNVCDEGCEDYETIFDIYQDLSGRRRE